MTINSTLKMYKKYNIKMYNCCTVTLEVDDITINEQISNIVQFSFV